MSWDVWKHGHPAIEIYGSEGSLRVPDPNFFGGEVEVTERGGELASSGLRAAMPLGARTGARPTGRLSKPNKANYRALGLAELANAVLTAPPIAPAGASVCTCWKSCTAFWKRRPRDNPER